MDALEITGGSILRGEVRISGSKNASLPIMAACLLAQDTSYLKRVPDLADVQTLILLLSQMGVKAHYQNNDLTLDATHLHSFEAPYELVRTMRASILVLGPLLARCGQAKVSLPGGCAIGARPIDQHLRGLQQLGADISIEHGYVVAAAPKGLVGADIVFDMPTVTGTENLMLAASLARGTTLLRNAAREPEIIDLAQALQTMGVEIHGAGTDTIEIRGQTSLRGAKHEVVADRIECGTFLVAGALLGDPLRVTGCVAEHQTTLINKLQAIGAHVEIGQKEDSLQITRVVEPQAINVQTAPYPGFPTDMQAQLMTLLAIARGTSVVSETIFENRFMHVAELDRLGAHIRVDGGTAIIQGVPALSGSTVMATDLRASACLVLAGLIAQGQTVVRRIYHLDRGYEHIENKLRQVGANIQRLSES